MTNNKSGNNNSQATTTTTTETKLVTTTSPESVLQRPYDEATYINSQTNNNFIRNNCITPTTYAHGIWYQQQTVGDANNANTQLQCQQQQQQQQKPIQQFYNNTHNNNENLMREQKNGLWSTTRTDGLKQQHQYIDNKNGNSPSNNNCDIIIVDIEDEQYIPEHQQPPPQQQQIIINANMKYPVHAKHTDKLNNNDNTNANANGVVDNADDDNDDVDDDDSLASMETLSDNVSIWIDGEKHWVAGVDEHTTCSDLIWVLLNYQNGQQPQHMYNAEDTQEIDRINVNQIINHQQQPKGEYRNFAHNYSTRSSNGVTTILCADNKPNKYLSSDTIHTNFPTTTTNPNITTTTTTSATATIHQSMSINTKENCNKTQNSSTDTAVAVAAKKSTISPSSSTPVSPPHCLALPFAVTLPSGITTASQLATEYVIVKQYHHCEEYLDGSTKVFDVLPPRDGPHKKECELLLRHLGPASQAVAMYNNNAATPQLSSLISTDKDSGMGSPVGSARSAKFRRRKHKSSQWLAQANTLHPKLSRCTANERLMKIILAQDETIQRQLSLLRDKERQITKIEEEKHRKRERDLGKNYLLETYLNGLDEAECEPEIQDGVEVFIDEPYQRYEITTSETTIVAAAATAVAAGGVHETIPSKAFSMIAKHKLKEKLIKKEKNKKKSHKDKLTKDEFKHATTTILQSKDSSSKTNKDKDRDRDRGRDKEKLPYKQRIFDENELSSGVTTSIDAVADIMVDDSNNEPEIEMQILWLEKIYTLNKQLQNEEELAAKLHAKVRKHQLRKTQQTQKEVQKEIEQLDSNLALQCGDIRKIEANLMETNEQLQKKLYMLERLSIEYLKDKQQQQVITNNDEVDEQQDTQENVKALIENHLGNNVKIIGNLEQSFDLQKLSINNLKSCEEVKTLQKTIAKASLETKATIKEIQKFPTTYVTSNNHIEIPKQSFSSSINHPHQIKLNAALNTTTLNTSNRQNYNSTHDYHQQHVIVTTSSINISVPTIAVTAANSSTMSPSSSSSSSSMFIDKNMLSSLQVQNAKTIKKQMFHTQTTTTTTATAMTATSPTIATATTIETNAFPKQQFQHFAQHMPTATASTILTSRPQISHQIPTSSIVVLKHPSAILSTAAATTLPLPPPVPVPASTSSPTPSLMAMNTVDISQLGTLV